VVGSDGMFYKVLFDPDKGDASVLEKCKFGKGLEE
jgi:hypothetical protein